jgi:hypothetical protein
MMVGDVTDYPMPSPNAVVEYEPKNPPGYFADRAGILPCCDSALANNPGFA